MLTEFEKDLLLKLQLRNTEFFVQSLKRQNTYVVKQSIDEVKLEESIEKMRSKLMKRHFSE